MSITKNTDQAEENKAEEVEILVKVWSHIKKCGHETKIKYVDQYSCAPKSIEFIIKLSGTCVFKEKK